MNYFKKFKEEIEKGSIKRVISLEEKTLGHEALYTMDGKEIARSGEIRGKTVEEIIAVKPHLVLFGAGHIGKAVTALGKYLDFKITVIDDRKGIFNDATFALTETINTSYEEAFKRDYDYNNPYYLIFTHGHNHDLECLRFALGKKSNYIGMIGSKGKIEKTYDVLKAEGFTDEELIKVHAPIGLDINANTPKEIAISIIGEVIKNYSQKHQLIVDNEILNFLANRHKECVLCTIVENKGSSPRATGAEMLVTEDETIGSVGGGAVENEAIKVAKETLKDKKNKIREYELNSQSSLGMICGGDNTILFQYIG